jgi:hypothetical protein
LIVNPTSAVEQFQQIKRFVVDSPSSNITIASATGTIQWQISDNAAFAKYSLIGSNSTTLTSAQIGPLTQIF